MKKHLDFLGSEAENKDRDRVYVIPVPVEWSTSYLSGTARAPGAILEASRQIEFYNPALDLDLERSGIVTLDPGIEDKDGLCDFIGHNRAMLLSAFSCFIGGEHSITPWILDSLGFDDIGIVWLDAHADMRESYLGERESHACAARNSLPFGAMVEIGVRSYSKEESEFLNGNNGVSVFGRWSAGAREAVKALPDRIYLSLDYDALDPSLIRAVGTPEPDGLDWNELIEILTFVIGEKKVVAMDAVELCPVEGDEVSNFLAAKIIYEAISRCLKKED